MEGEFTAAVLTMVAKSSSPEMASRLAHGEKEVLIPLSSLHAIHGSGDVCLTFLIESDCAESLTRAFACMTTPVFRPTLAAESEMLSLLMLLPQLTWVKRHV